MLYIIEYIFICIKILGMVNTIPDKTMQKKIL